MLEAERTGAQIAARPPWMLSKVGIGLGPGCCPKLALGYPQSQKGIKYSGGFIGKHLTQYSRHMHLSIH